MQPGTAEDELFGAVRWQQQADRVQVRGDRIPVAEIVRTGRGASLPHIPIGTRDPARLTMTLAGRPVELLPGRGRLSRRSYRVAVLAPDGPLLLTPCSPTAARLVRGGSFRGDNELGVFERSSNGSSTVTWSGAVSALGRTVEAPTPTPDEAAVGHALALAFDTGAQLFLPTLADALGRFIPG